MLARLLLSFLLLVPAASWADLLVNLDATDKPTGSLATWANTGTLAGGFTAGPSTPNVVTVNLPSGGTVRAVLLNGSTSSYYTGPVAPDALTGSNAPRTIEAWVLNASVNPEETILAWGRRGSDGANSSFNYGSNPAYGAVGHFGGAYDLGWATTPTAAVWHYLVYTYDGTTARVYVDGVESSSRAVALATAATSTGGAPLPIRVGVQNNADGTVAATGLVASMHYGRLRIRDELLTLSQIRANYAAEATTFGRNEPSIANFSASHVSTLPGQSVTLSWNLVNATSASISPGVGAVNPVSGSVVVSPTTPTTYTITANNAAANATANVTVTPLAPVTLRNRWSFSNAPGAAVNGTQVNDLQGTSHAFIRGTGAIFTGGQVDLPGGSSATAPYVDLPNGLLSSLNEITIEGWMTLKGAQTWSRYFDFGTGEAGEIFGPGGGAAGTEYLTLSAQVGGTTNLRRLALRDNNVEQSADLTDTVAYGTEFHFAVVYKADGNFGQPQLQYYKNGALVGVLNTTFRLQNIQDVNNWIGRSNWTGDNNTQASYNEFRIWNGALSAGAVADVATAGPNSLPQVPRIDAFAATGNTTIYRGESARLSFVLGDPAGLGLTASIDQGVGAVSTPSGFADVTPQSTTTYTLTVSNSAGTRTAQTTINVLPSGPTVQDLTVQAEHQTAKSITLLATDPNTPVDSLTFTVLSGPSNGTISGTGRVRTYTPAAGYSGPDFFTYRANDGISDSNIATVSIQVLGPPAPPSDLVPNDTVIRTSASTGSFIARLRPVDPNPSDTFTLALVSGVGDTHNSYFTLNGNQLIANRSFAGDLGQTISVRIRVTDNTGRSFDKVLTFPVEAPDLRVRINEVHYNPARNTMLTEFVELYNPGATAVNVSGWRLTEGVEYQFPSGTSIPAGGYLVVAKDPPSMLAYYNVNALGPWTGGLDSMGEEIVLRDPAGSRVDDVSYGITAPWPATPNGDGPTLELVHPMLDNDFGSNWRASTVTPAAVTFLAAGSSGWSYRKGTSEASAPVGAWHAETFTQDASWLTGQAPIGVHYRNNGTAVATNPETGVTLATQLTDMASYVSSNAGSSTNYSVNYRSVYFRRSFNVSGAIPKHILLKVQHNDAAIVWINGVEVVRFGFPPGATGDAPFNTAAVYERGNDPWSEVVLANADALLHQGANTIAIHGFAKPPQTRTTQEDLGIYNVFDFSVDAAITNVPDTLGTPGAQNSVFSTASGPAVRQILHAPSQPASTNPITVTARVSDPQGVGAVTLRYQVVAPGAYLPSTLPLTNAQILANPAQELPANPAFEAPANWLSIPMVDDGSVPGDVVGDGVFTAVIPAQPHRTLVRYRIFANDLAGMSTRVPAVEDPRKNFAVFVYDGVPPYISGSASFSTASLNTLPAYHWITRASDFSALLAYNASEQFGNTSDLNVLLARRFENFQGTLVVGDQVIDHAEVRLRGGNSRYNGFGKRHFRFAFPKGTPLYAADEAGREYARPWEDMLFNKLFGNKGYYDWGLPYEVGGKMWSLMGIPIPESHWVHFRVVQDANQSHATLGDFWGLYQALEYPDGPNFLGARDLERGNFYKMSDWMQNGEMDLRSQAPGAVEFGADFDNIRYNIHQTATDAFIQQYVHMPLYYRYNAIQEAIRHYDIFVEPTGRHRVKNLIWYFQPVANNPLGKLWFMPYDWDASFGPTWNLGRDFVNNAIYDYYDIPDSPTWQLPKKTPRTAMAIEHRNAIREVRDLLVYRDPVSGRGPVDDIIDDAVAKLAAFYPADQARWPSPGAAANYTGGAPSKAADMKAFLFSGWTDTSGAGDPGIGAGGRAAYLDSISDGIDAGFLPATPTITNSSSTGNPVDGIVLTSTAFSDPQGPGTFAAMQWRIGEITDVNAPAYDPGNERVYEVTEVWGSGELPTFSNSIAVPANALRVGHTYRARVRHKDTTGRWSHWSAPATFTTTTSNYVRVLNENLMTTEIMYRPAAGTGGFLAEDFEYIELTNISNALTLDLTNVRFTKGVDFDFLGSAVTSLAPGERVLVVKNAAAFASRHGSGMRIAGEWDIFDSLSNSGEEVKLSFGAGAAIHEFIYDDAAPWPTGADVGGYSLVLINPTLRPNHAVASNWRASSRLNGTPGTAGTTYTEWATVNQVGGALVDHDGDSLVNQLEYAFGGSPTGNSLAALPVRGLQELTVNGTPGRYLTLTFRRVPSAEDLIYHVEFANTLPSWNANGALVGSVPQPDGTILETWRAPTPQNPGFPQFGRVRVKSF